MLFPEAIDDYITQDNPVRFIDAFVERTNLRELGFIKTEHAKTGRPGYEPKDLLKLYIYGYKNRITSSRRIDGTKIKGVNNISLNDTKPLLQKKLKEINQRIDAYLKEIEETDEKESDRVKPTAEG
ncbi:MAG: hypothetical protein WBK96_07240 [Candidatus Manganitrophaceae bacterium]